VHWDPCEEIHERDLPKYGPEDIHGLQANELIAFEAEILFEASDVGIVWTNQ
jgi:hypothetical protein